MGPSYYPDTCKLLSNRYAYLLQLVLGVTALMSLIYKRQTESPRRPFDVWFMDVSKQGFSSVLVHFWNIGLSIIFANLSSNDNRASDECAFYFINFLLDTFVGVFLVWLLLKVQMNLAHSYEIDALKYNGYYGTPPQLRIYVQQLLCFLLVIVMSKFLLGFFVFSVHTWIEHLGNAIFRPLKGHPDTELTVVMVICPCFLNILQYWIQDNFLMDTKEVTHSYVPIGEVATQVQSHKEMLVRSMNLS